MNKTEGCGVIDTLQSGFELHKEGPSETSCQAPMRLIRVNTWSDSHCKTFLDMEVRKE